ncbi:MAG TPA: M50 family metallopeptidase [Acidimicrobiales bacterium]|nr:M50 family metallopeptidase [Acidimicrobiales bacterium]
MTLTTAPSPPAGGGPTPDTSEQRAAFGRLALIVAAGVLAALVTHTASTVAVVLAIVGMIMLHEFGHFITAKWAGMKVTEYFLGFGPRLWSFRRGETEYGIKAVPAGGYVKIVGMHNLDQVDPADEARTYRQASFPRRVLVVSAGSAMHFLIALVLMWAVIVFVGTPSATKVAVGGLSRIDQGPTPAQQAGLRNGDIFVSVNGRRFTSSDALRSYIQHRPGQALAVVVDRHGRTVPLTLTPVDEREVTESGQHLLPPNAPATGLIGVVLSTPLEKANPLVGTWDAVNQLGHYVWTVLGALGQVFSPHGLANYGHQLSGHVATGPGASTANGDRFISPVGIVRLASDAAQSGLLTVLELLIAINVFVGVFNMVPLLPLDGGHVAIAVYERIRSRRGKRYFVDVRRLMPATYAVMVLILFLGVTSLYLDITHPIPNPFQ